MSDDSQFKAPIVIILVDSGSGPAPSAAPAPTATIVDAPPTPAPPPNPPPVADFTASPQLGLDPLTVNFTDQSSNNPTTWAWDFENNGSTDSTLQNPTFVYTTPGTYSVKLTVTNAYGSDSIVKTGYIVVNPPTDFDGDVSPIPNIIGFGLNVLSTDVATDMPSDAIFGNNVLATNLVTDNPVYLEFGPNTFSTDNITSFPVSLIPSPATYIYYGNFAGRNGYDGDVGVAGYIGSIPPYSVSPANLQTNGSFFGDSHTVLTTVGIQGTETWDGGGNASDPANAVGPMAIGESRTMTADQLNQFYSNNYFLPMQSGEQIWVVDQAFPSYGGAYAISVMVGQNSNSGVAYYITGTMVNSPSFFSTTITRLASQQLIPSIILRTDGYNMDYLSSYQSYNSSQGWDPLANIAGGTGTFDTSLVPTLSIGVQPNQAYFGLQGSQTVIGANSLTYQTGGWVWEYKILATPSSGNNMQVGYFTQAYGPPFSPDTSAGGPLSTYYASNGTIQGYGSTITGDTWTAGDVIGVIYHSSTGEVVFFKNGTYIGTVGATTNDGFVMAGVL